MVKKTSKYLLTNNCHKLGIYRFGGGYIIDPSTTLMFNDEVENTYNNLTQGEGNAKRKKKQQ